MKLSIITLLLIASEVAPGEIHGVCPPAHVTSGNQVFYETGDGTLEPAFATDLEAAIVAVSVANRNGGNQCFVFQDGEYVFYTLDTLM